MFKMMAAANAVGKLGLPSLPCKGHPQHGPGEASLAAPKGSTPKDLLDQKWGVGCLFH